ncbi:MAG: PorT family protein, partial [Bacteroidetes bacterium]
MKSLINLLILLAMCAGAAPLPAQQLRLIAGVNITDMYYHDKAKNENMQYTSKQGIHVGLGYERILSPHFSVEGRALITTKGAIIATWDEQDLSMLENRTHFVYLEVPLSAKLYHDFGGAVLYAKAGISGSVAMVGRSAFTLSGVQGEEQTYEEAMVWGEKENPFSFRRWDYGLLVGVGAEAGPVLLEVSCQWGEANLFVNSKREAYHAVLAFTAAWRLWGG